MDSVTIITGRAAVYPGTNVDTDEIIPARFLYRDRKDGFADTLFHDLRLDPNGKERPDFVLNKPQFRDPVVIVGGYNFGCGSSREHAVWALMDRGIRCVIAESFGDIFRNNAIENGLLPVMLKQDTIAILAEAVSVGAPCEITVDLKLQTVIAPDGIVYSFDFEPSAKAALIAGFNSIDLTFTHMDEITSFENSYRLDAAWVFEPRPPIMTKRPDG